MAAAQQLMLGYKAAAAFDPTTLTGYVNYSLPSIATLRANADLWQNTGKTTGATANTNPVRVLEAVGGDYTAPSDAARPVLTDEGSGKWSLAADGSDDRLTTAASVSHGIGTGDFWLACRMRAASGGDYRTVFSASSDTLILLQMSTNRLNLVMGSNDYLFNTALTAGTWYTVEVARESGTLKAWVDGVQEATTHAGVTNDVTNNTWDLFSTGSSLFGNQRLAGLWVCAAAPSQQTAARSYLGAL
jgi:hypothetical protein